MKGALILLITLLVLFTLVQSKNSTQFQPGDIIVTPVPTTPTTRKSCASGYKRVGGFCRKINKVELPEEDLSEEDDQITKKIAQKIAKPVSFRRI
jgi:hypothetical protein